LPGGDRLEQRLDRRGAAGGTGEAAGQERVRPVPARSRRARVRAMKLVETDLPGCVVIEPQVFGDDRGYFFESFNRDKLEAHGLTPDFVQGNVSSSARGVLRGLHYQWPNPQGKYVS